jgi:23S rRNA (adenine2503-C2)-methyltransferase
LRSWCRASSYDNARSAAENFFPKFFKENIHAIESELDKLANLKAFHPAEEGVGRLLVELADGQLAESVLLPKGGLCVSTQIGCAVGCVFCMSGRDGLKRQLGSMEIIAQVVLARKMRKVSKVVFMGMGEPSHNLENVLEAIDILGTHGDIGHKNLVFSTVGDYRVFERLPKERVRPALALSLHSADEERRAGLLPRAPRIPVKELVDLAEDYARLTHYPIQYQWTLLEGINDGHEEMENLIRLLSGKYAVMNFIPYNSAEGLGFNRPSSGRIVQAVRMLKNAGIVAKVRDSAGQEIDGACGQLRARALERGQALRA